MDHLIWCVTPKTFDGVIKKMGCVVISSVDVAIMERSASLDMIITLVVIVCVIVIFVIAVEAEVLAKIEVVVFEVVVPIVETEEAVIEVVKEDVPAIEVAVLFVVVIAVAIDDKVSAGK